MLEALFFTEEAEDYTMNKKMCIFCGCKYAWIALDSLTLVAVLFISEEILFVKVASHYNLQCSQVHRLAMGGVGYSTMYKVYSWVGLSKAIYPTNETSGILEA